MSLFSGIEIKNYVLFNFQGGLSLSSMFYRKPKLDKLNSQILFIDDEKFPIVDNLSKAGWNVSRLRDLHNPDDEAVQKANIIFVDYRGVGGTLAEHEQGLGIVKILKEKYGKKKRVILYSAYSFKLDQEIDLADNKIAKGSDTHQFIALMEDELSKL